MRVSSLNGAARCTAAKVSPPHKRPPCVVPLCWWSPAGQWQGLPRGAGGAWWLPIRHEECWKSSHPGAMNGYTLDDGATSVGYRGYVWRRN